MIGWPYSCACCVSITNLAVIVASRAVISSALFSALRALESFFTLASL